MRYILKSFLFEKELEKFEGRNPSKIYEILCQPRNNRNGEPTSMRDNFIYPNRFEIYDSYRTLLFDGNVTDALSFCKTLR